MKSILSAELPEYGQALLDAAKQAQNNAYAPYSNYKVGASVIGLSGRIYSGCNVENAAYTGSHAETGAIAQMVAAGETELQAAACVTKDGGSPCGDCRQRIWELCRGNTELPIYLMSGSGDIQVTTIGELLPFAFDLS